ILARVGARTSPPKAGDAAEFWVEVDTTPPVVSLPPPILGGGSETGTLTILWTASDPNLTDAPIALAYAAAPQGPWQPIATGLKNEGIHRWKLPAGVPGQMYLRVEATDRAGNVGRYVTPTPVNLATVSPNIHLRGVSPAQMPAGQP
ncbi:MAG TPA: hypothetical protein VIL46_12750, partial [Gemmataceae bacterium]